MITVRVEVQDADVAQQIADLVCKRLQTYITRYRTNKARKDVTYSEAIAKNAYDKYIKSQTDYAAFCDTHEDVTLTSYQQVQDRLENEMQLAFNTYSQCAQQLQLAKMKLQERTPVYTTIQPATVPQKPCGPKRVFTILAFTMLSFFGSVCWILMRDMLKRSKQTKTYLFIAICMRLSLNAVKSNGRELTDTIYLIILQGANQLLPLFVMPFLMIKLGAEGYGFVGFSLSVIQYLVLIVDFGFNLSATKRIAQANDDVDKCNEVFWNVVAAKSLLLVVSSVILLVLMLTVPTFQLYSQAIWATWPMLLGSTFTFMWFFQGKGYIRFFSVMNTLSKLALLPLIFVFVKTPDDCSLAAFLQAVVFVGTAIISNIYIYCKRLVQWHTPSWKGIKEELAESFPLFLSTASTSVYTQLIVIVLGFYCTTSEVGKYASADRIMRALCFLLYVPLNQVFFPKISALAVKGKDLAAGLFKQVMLMVILVMCCVSAFLFSGASICQICWGMIMQA